MLDVLNSKINNFVMLYLLCGRGMRKKMNTYITKIKIAIKSKLSNLFQSSRFFLFAGLQELKGFNFKQKVKARNLLF